MKSYLIGIDIGTSACKAAVFTPSGEIVSSASAGYKVLYPGPDTALQHPDDWWSAVCSCLKTITSEIDPYDIACIGVDGQSWSAAAVDRNGEVLCPTPIWTDTSSVSQCEFMLKIIPESEWFAAGRNPVRPGYTLPKILKYKDETPGIYEKTEYILQSNGFIVYRLTGRATLDYSQGYGLQCFDMQKRIIREDMLGAIGIRASLIPSPMPCGEIAGYVTARAANETGLAEGTPVVAGGLDAACASLGVGATSPGRTQEQGGQAGGMSICTAGCDSTPELIMSCHVVPGMYLLQGGTTGGGGALRWLRSVISPDLSFAEMDEAASSVPPGSGGLLFLPYLAGERSPVWNPGAKGVFYGLTYSHTKAHMIRAVLEGTAYALRHNLETAAKAGAEVDVMRAMGGSALSRVWTQIKADVTGKTIEVPVVNEATVLGAALLAGEGAGVIESAAAAADGIIKTGRVHNPGGAKAVYDREFARYLELYERLSPMMKQGETQ